MLKKIILTIALYLFSFQNINSQIWDNDLEWTMCSGGTQHHESGSISYHKNPIITLTDDGGFFEVSNFQLIGTEGFEYHWLFKKRTLDLNITFDSQILSGGEASDVKKTSDNGYIIVGYTSPLLFIPNIGNGGKDIQIVKLDSLGNFQWQKFIGGSNDDIAYSVQETIDGGYVIAGYSNSNDYDVVGNQGNKDCLVVKLDQNGNIEWQKSIGGLNNEIAYSIQQTSDGGYIIVGKSDSNDAFLINNHGLNDILVLKLDSLGNNQWVKAIGGSNDDIAYIVKQTIDGGYVIAGQTNSLDFDIQGNHGANDCVILKLNENGNIEWSKCIGGTDEDVAYSIQQTTDDSYIVAGFTSSNDFDISGNYGMKDFLYLKLNSNGNIIHQKCFGTYYDDKAFSVNETIDGGVILAGNTLENSNFLNTCGYSVLKYSPTLSQDNFDYANLKITIFPNPANTQINIDFNKAIGLNGGTIRIINSIGQFVLTTPISTSYNNSTMPLQAWGKAGLYFLQIINPQGEIVDIKKIILQ